MAGQIPETTPGFHETNFKYTPLRHLRVLFVRFVQGLFSAAPPGNYHWSADDALSEIVVTNEGKLDELVMNKRPAVTFTRGPITFWSVGLDDMSEYDFATGRKVKDVLVPGTMTMNVISRFPIECEDIAWVIAEHMWLLRHLLLRTGFFEIARQPQIGSSSAAGSIIAGDSGDEFYVVPVSVPFQFTRRSAYTPLNARIVEGIEQSLSINPTRRPFSRGVPSPAPQLNIHECPPPPFTLASDVRGRSPDPAGSRSPSALVRTTHPLNPAKEVFIRRVYPHRSGQSLRGVQVPIVDPCVEESVK